MNWVPDFRQVRAFVAVAEQGSFTLAAREIHLTQSAVSHSIRSLEEQMECKLLDRSRRQVRLTPEGAKFLLRCRRIMEELGEIARDFEPRKPGSGLI